MTYTAAFADRQQDWQSIQSQLLRYKKRIPFIPSPAVGWDASSRGELAHPSRYERDQATHNQLWEQYKDKHPYRPIVIDGSPELFGQALEAAIDFTVEHVPEDERLVTIFAWNEISEGASLLPRLINGSVDNSYLEAVYSSSRLRASIAARDNT